MNKKYWIWLISFVNTFLMIFPPIYLSVNQLSPQLSITYFLATCILMVASLGVIYQIDKSMHH